MVLHDLTLYAKPGQKVAFVGSTGAGKTTITNLINRFSMMCRMVRSATTESTSTRSRRQISVILWESYFRIPTCFTGTIMENIRYGKLDATDEEVYAAARLAPCGISSSICFQRDMIRYLPVTVKKLSSGTASAAGYCQSRHRRPAGIDSGRGNFQHRYPYRAYRAAGYG